MAETNWTSVGGHLVGNLGGRGRVLDVIERLLWESPDGKKPMVPALAIREAIRELRLPRVTAIAISGELAPNGFYGIEANYKDGPARIYLLDTGTAITPLLSVHEPERVAA